MTKYLVICLINFTIIFSSSCTKKADETTNKGDSTKTAAGDKTQGDKPQQTAVSDTVFFGQWNGKKIIIEDNYKYQANEKTMTSSEGSDYYAYGEKLKELVKKHGKYSEKEYEYYFTDYKPGFEKYTSLKPGQMVYISTPGGVHSAKINGYYINLDDMIGAGAIFYATADAPGGTKFDEREMMVCSFNSNMAKLNKTGVTEQAVIDKFKSHIMPKLKDVMITDYQGEKEVQKRLSGIENEDIKLFKGSFTGAGKEEYLAGIRINNTPTSFTTVIYLMDAEGKIIKEFSPYYTNNWTFSMPEMITDFNGDGIDEIITIDGYYEGSGYNFHMLQKDGSFKTQTNGFTFGV